MRKQLEILYKMIELYPTLPDWQLTLSDSKKGLRYYYENQWLGAADAIVFTLYVTYFKS